MKPHYRICADDYAGYEVQVWRWWWPFWVMAGGCNTFFSVDRAEAYAKAHSKQFVKYLGPIGDRP